MKRKQSFIAEIKTKSPFGFAAMDSFLELCDVAIVCGDVVAVHTNIRWGGHFDLVKYVRSRTGKFILAKGVHESDDDIKRAIDDGADAALVVGRMPEEKLWPWCWFEPTTIEQLKTLGTLPAVWNARDLRDGKPKAETWEEARKVHGGILYQASLIRTKDDIKPDCDGFIVGEHMKTLARQLRPSTYVPLRL